MPKKASLLIVDDDKDVLETLSGILKERGYLIETAKTGKESPLKRRLKRLDHHSMNWFIDNNKKLVFLEPQRGWMTDGPELLLFKPIAKFYQ